MVGYYIVILLCIVYYIFVIYYILCCVLYFGMSFCIVFLHLFLWLLLYGIY